ncbi:MAG TPA: hypothetical protein VN634_03005 [Candidatus Limnocylindrales bacterium]|nr:hypothetical protein [Candidatus Limnocylindrales bacterium]
MVQRLHNLLVHVGITLAVTCSVATATTCGDLDNNGKVVTSDALRLLKFSVGQSVDLSCPAGLSCWDTDNNGVCDAEEDVSGDDACSVEDCKGPKGDPGEPADAELLNDLDERVATLESSAAGRPPSSNLILYLGTPASYGQCGSASGLATMSVGGHSAVPFAVPSGMVLVLTGASWAVPPSQYFCTNFSIPDAPNPARYVFSTCPTILLNSSTYGAGVYSFPPITLLPGKNICASEGVRPSVAFFGYFAPNE